MIADGAIKRMCRADRRQGAAKIQPILFVPVKRRREIPAGIMEEILRLQAVGTGWSGLHKGRADCQCYENGDPVTHEVVLDSSELVDTAGGRSREGMRLPRRSRGRDGAFICLSLLTFPRQ